MVSILENIYQYKIYKKYLNERESWSNFMNDRLYATCESNLKQCVLFLGEKRINGNMFCYDFIKMLCTPIMTVCKGQIYIAWVAKWKGKL